MKHRYLVGLHIIFIVLLFSGCAGQTTGTTTETSASPAETATPDTVTVDGKTYQLVDSEKSAAATPAPPSTPVTQKPATPPPAPSTTRPATPDRRPSAESRPETSRPGRRPAEKAPARTERPAESQRVTLAAGTPVEIITSTELSTKNVQSGDEFEAVLNANLTDGNRVIARRGAVVKGVVVAADQGGRVKGVATMSLQLTGLTLADGRQVKVQTNSFDVSASTSVKKDATKVGIGAGLGAVIGAIAGGGKGAAIGAGIGGAAGTGTAMATRGDPAVVASETQITFNLTEPLTITPAK